MKTSRRQPHAFCRLGEAHRGEVIDLAAYRIAERLFWWYAAHGEDHTFEEIYSRVVAALGSYRASGSDTASGR